MLEVDEGDASVECIYLFEGGREERGKEGERGKKVCTITLRKKGGGGGWGGERKGGRRERRGDEG